MDINDILASLGLDLTNAEVKRGAAEAIKAILDSRQAPDPMSGSGNGPTDSQDIEIDPDLLQPSQKHQAMTDDDIEIEDEENLLDQVKHNDSETDTSGDVSGTDSSMDTDSSNNSTKSNRDDESSSNNSTKNDEDSDTQSSKNTDADDTNNSEKTNFSDDDLADDQGTSDDSTDEASTADGANEGEEGENGDGIEPSEQENNGATGDENSQDGADGEETGTTGGEGSGANNDAEDTDDKLDDTAIENEDGLLDDELKGTYDSQELKTKNEARRIKRERTLAAAKQALTSAQARNVSNTLIKELEKSIAALEELTEAVKKLGDISDEEFNRLVNRVFDAIDAVGDKSLTFTTDEERQIQAQKIKADLASQDTRADLSAEDAKNIRDSTQATKAREKEADKYRQRARDSFKGFQDFLNSLYRAIAMQVKFDEVRDDTWSAISRRSAGAGVLQPGKRIQDLPDKKIPIIDFYFDCSGSWGSEDIKVGKEAVKKLAEMEEEGKIKINIYYFSDNVHSDFASAEAEGGTSAWNDIVKNVISTRATNVIIMTDSDMENYWRPMSQDPLRYTVPGYVWYLWKNGSNAPRLPRDLKGRGGVQQFSFKRGDVG